MKEFDAIVIGSGQAGTPLAFRLASAGRKTLLIEREHFGGTCVNDGCTPTKAYIASARRMWEARNGEELGIFIPEGTRVDLQRVKKRKDKLVMESIKKIKEGIEKEKNLTSVTGEAVFSGRKKITVNGEEVRGDNIYINTGSRPAVPEGFENVNYLTNQTILQIEELPEHLVIIGGSYNGLEFGQMFRRFGSRVTIVERNGRIAGHEDEEISETIHSFLLEEGIDFRLNANCIEGRQNNNGSVTVKVECSEGEPEITGSHLLLAVGRKPNTGNLNLEKTGVKTDGKGYIRVNDFLETDAEGIYAIGECNGHGTFTHTAYNDFEIIAGNLLEGKNKKVSERIVTYALYTDPPLGRAGITREEALEKGLKFMEAKLPMKNVARARERAETKGLMHILTDTRTRKILGAAILGTGGDEIISSILHVMYADASFDVIINAVKPHPTVSELLPSLLHNLRESG